MVQPTKWRVVAACLPLLGALVGCPAPDSSKSDTAESESTGWKPVPQNPLAGAPGDWAGLAAWATPRLSQPLPGTPVPEPVAPQNRWPVIRLDQRLGQATVRGAWQPSPAGSEAVATLGPFRSDRPGAGFEVQAQPGGFEPGINLVAKGLAIPADQVGSIVIELHQPFGRHFDLRWSRAGRIRVPLPDNTRFWTLSIATAGLAEWTGSIRQIAIKTDGIGSAPIEIRSIRFLAQADSFPKAVGARRVALDRWTRDALYMHAPAEVVFHAVTLPPDAKFQTGVGAVTGGKSKVETRKSKSQSGAEAGASLDLEVLVQESGTQTSVFKRSLADASSWTEVECSLKPWAGKTVSIVLRADTSDAQTVACWGNPVIYQPQQNPPCVIVYLIDALAAEHIDLYGYARPTMPRLKGLASRGVWFANMFANSPRTVESIPDLMLSLPTWRHGVYHPSATAADKLVTLAEVLGQAGFATVSFCTNVNAGPRQNIDQGFGHFVDRIAYWWSGNVDRTVPIDDALAWLATHRDRPTFLYIHTAEPHAPYTPLKGFAGRFDPDYEGTVDGTYDRETGYRTAATRRDIGHVVALYDEEVAYADHRLGLFADALGRADLLDRVLMFVTADHGEQFLQHGSWEHGADLHNELTRIPLVAFGPGVSQ
ncbi:MAG: sulfatase, partial [Phycisphaerae bacterium]